MSDLISRSELKKAIKEEICNFELPISANEIMPIIDNAPTVDISKLILIVAKRSGKREMMLNALRPTGEWLEIGKYQVECDQCHYDDCAIKTNFCPNCGADMRGGRE